MYVQAGDRLHAREMREDSVGHPNGDGQRHTYDARGLVSGGCPCMALRSGGDAGWRSQASSLLLEAFRARARSQRSSRMLVVGR